ncbi:OmpA family protein [Pelagibacterium sp.]|uniref:OmpA family protein n=1 Tax=Pelagibacterium sp. TaxID=1967288 RepID=UPI003BAA3A8D
MLSFVLPAVFILTPIQSALAQYQSLDATAGAETSGQFAWAVQVSAGEITLSGNVPYQSVATILAERAGIDGVDVMTIADGAPLGFLRDAMKAIAASEILEEGSIAYGEGQWTVSGNLQPDGSLETLTEALGVSAGAGAEWVFAVDAPEAAEAESTDAPEPIDETVMDSVEELLEESGAPDEETMEIIENAEPGPDVGDAAGEQTPADEIVDAVPSVDGAVPANGPQAPAGDDGPQGEANVPEQDEAAPADTIIPAETSAASNAQATQCREQVATLTRAGVISFASGRATPTAASEDIISDIAAALAICPSQPVYVEGHTDADGLDQTNLVLSLSRAEAVVDRLVEQGVDPQRLFAVGYGASLPVASNETAAGKAQNRRIVFSFEDIAQ